jgi:hypothetical protein
VFFLLYCSINHSLCFCSRLPISQRTVSRSCFMFEFLLLRQRICI